MNELCLAALVFGAMVTIVGISLRGGGGDRD